MVYNDEREGEKDRGINRKREREHERDRDAQWDRAAFPLSMCHSHLTGLSKVEASQAKQKMFLFFHLKPGHISELFGIG